jgi:DNA primase
MRIPESKIAEVSAAADIVQVISGYVDLKKAGKDYRGLCPFHGDKDPSFYVSPQKGIFHCFGCATGGSVFNFIMKMENVPFAEAVQILARKYGVSFHFDRAHRASDDDRPRLMRALEIAQSYFTETWKASPDAREYLTNRGVPLEWCETLGLGFARDAWDSMSTYLRSKGVDVKDAVAAGLIRERPSGGYYDYFRSRVTIPIRDLSGGIVGFGGRIYGEGDPKYLNSPESSVFRKKNVLYGLEAAREAIRREGMAILVEGYFDQISLRIRGLENTVAPLGTALGSEQIRLLKRFTTEIVTVFDGDEAGVRAVKRSIPLFLAEGLEPRCLILTEDKDPDEAVNRIGIDGFRQLLDKAVSMMDLLIDGLAARYDLNTLHGRNLALEECIPVIKEIADSKERDYFIERFSSGIRIKEERLRRVLKSGLSHRTRNDRIQKRRTLFDFPADERNVVRGILLREDFMDRVLESGALKDLEDPILKELAERMVNFRQEHGFFEPVAFARSVEDEKLASVLAGWLQPRPEEDDLRPEVDGDRAIDQSLDCIRLRKLEKRKVEIKERMKRCPPGEDEYNLLAQELLAIGRRLRK